MRNIISAICLSLLIISCGNNKTGQPIVENDTALDIYTWEADYNDSTGHLEMEKVLTGKLDTLSAPAIISYLNNDNPHIKLDYLKTSGDTVYVEIKEADYLTQQMGSSGPMYYMSEVIYNLTELPGIHYVNFKFEEGDHAIPGTFNRDSFKNE
jgi:hypothetical protein